MSDAQPNPTANNQDQLAELLRGPTVSARPEFRAELRNQLMTMQVPPSAPTAPVAQTSEVSRWLLGLVVAAVAVGATLVATGLPFQDSAPTDAPVPAAVEPVGPGGGNGEADRDGANDSAANMDGDSETDLIEPSPADPSPVLPTPSGPADSPSDVDGASGAQRPVRPAAPLGPQATSTALPPASQPGDSQGHADPGNTDPGKTDPGSGDDDDPTAPPATATPEPTNTRDVRTPATPLPTNTAEASPGPRITATPGSPTPETNFQDDTSLVDP